MITLNLTKNVENEIQFMIKKYKKYDVATTFLISSIKLFAFDSVFGHQFPQNLNLPLNKS